MANIHFSMAPKPVLRRLALLMTALLALFAGCQGGSAVPELSDEETLLVAELVQLHRLQILQDANPALADSLRAELRLHVDGATLDERVRALGDDPTRGAVLLRAVRDSLAANRRELFGSATALEEAPRRPRHGVTEATQPAEGDRDDD